ncbi:hypothetical protein [Bacillus sp. JCM 19034]|uniref:hypothetical protein n=1 Tax=Bacillus sp. JCM 19034 TaxID=1481928 RepID=UPI0007825A1B|nr:hypothetical protein [Bacillus sp. JCM 19034]
MDRVKFYSKNDLAYGWELNKVIERIEENAIEKDWSLEDVIEFFNILKYVQVDRFAEYIQEKTNVICTNYSKKIKARIGKFISTNKSFIISKYDDTNYSGTEDFLEIVEKYKLYEDISHLEFKTFLDKDSVPLYMVLKHKKIVEHFDDIVKIK